MGPTETRRPVAAALILGLALTLAAGLPTAPVPAAGCSCCNEGLCRLAAPGCDHRRAAAPEQLTSCCVRAAGPSGKAAAAGPLELESAILLASPTLAAAAAVSWRSCRGLLLPAAPALGPERPPPRSPSALRT